MSERKTIQINPELFTFSANKTRKKHNKIADPSKPIRIRSPRKEKSNAMKSRLLKYIRQHQEAKDKQRTNPIPVLSTKNEFENDFESSLTYLSSIAEKTQNAVPKTAVMRHNTTLRQYPSMTTPSLVENAMTEVSVDLPDVFEPAVVIRPPIQMPKYGCLKNGTLPTYRMWKSQTLKVPPSMPLSISNPIRNDPTIAITAPKIANPPNHLPIQMGVDTNIRASIAKHREIQKKRGGVKPAIKKQKQKRILRRTYRVGKSKHYPKVAVLVSNKTLRNQTSTKIQLLKQTPMEEVKRELIKKGLIKVGSTAPTDVLRKMYESISLVCGDIQNHNPENLLYNYFNAK